MAVAGPLSPNWNCPEIFFFIHNVWLDAGNLQRKECENAHFQQYSNSGLLEYGIRTMEFCWKFIKYLIYNKSKNVTFLWYDFTSCFNNTTIVDKNTEIQQFWIQIDEFCICNRKRKQIEEKNLRYEKPISLQYLSQLPPFLWRHVDTIIVYWRPILSVDKTKPSFVSICFNFRTVSTQWDVRLGE